MRKIFHSKKTTLLAALALVMVLGASLPGALAYFTTYVTAQGTKQLTLGWETELHENFENSLKTIQVENTGELDCYVRVGIFSGSMSELEYQQTENWTLERTPEGDYWYYNEVVPAGGSTSDLIVLVKNTDSADAAHNVIVVQECAPVQYDDDGNPLPPTDETVWSQQFEIVEGEGA